MQLEKKKEVVQNFGEHETDTGGMDVQVALLTERIKEITSHTQTHKKDFASRRGLLMLVGKRSRLLRHLKKNYPSRYSSLISRLGLRK